MVLAPVSLSQSLLSSPDSSVFCCDFSGATTAHFLSSPLPSLLFVAPIAPAGVSAMGNEIILEDARGVVTYAVVAAAGAVAGVGVDVGTDLWL